MMFGQVGGRTSGHHGYLMVAEGNGVLGSWGHFGVGCSFFRGVLIGVGRLIVGDWLLHMLLTTSLKS